MATVVAKYHQVERLASAAVEKFGRIDTWVDGASCGPARCTANG
ncbi:hypothetical protein [Pseudonocardia asaccharolytica]|nr:hypothetical protein [Pseudonocardia asaccharolytica]